LRAEDGTDLFDAKEDKMAEYGEWSRKGATLSDITAKKEYRVDRDFIIKGIEEGKLEYRHASVWGSPFIKILRRQLEDYIKAELGEEYLEKAKAKTEFLKIKKEMAEIKKRLRELEAGKAELEKNNGKIMNK
jgi:predicted nuclease with TOPRIM domain